MRRRIFLTLFIASFALITGCSQDISNTKQQVENKAKEIGFKPQLDEALDKCDNARESDYIRFLYAFMPIGDIADYAPDLYVQAVKASIIAKKEMPWGKNVPEKIFRHFVLPLRVNNENLDSCRTVFYNELKDRVKGLSMYDAALEVNHWCHEKVVYIPTDARTSSPLSTVRTAFGRCGEESVFAAAAMRAVGIPARQVYTPRWAHTDDNHAWIEVWIDGKWHYLGACEPEAKLDVAWFSSTALRSMLMHTRVFGNYKGDEDVISTTNCFTEINVTSNYAPVGRVEVTVKDTLGNVVSGADVEFKIYNYAELYSAINTRADENGKASALMGKGNVVVWASFGPRFGYAMTSGGEPVTVVLNRMRGNVFDDLLDIVPPAEGTVPVIVTDEESVANAVRLKEEDSLRTIYTNTFYNPLKNASTGGIDLSSGIYDKYLIAARGNWREILRYINSLTADQHDAGLRMLDLISEKDLRDTPSDVLIDHIEGYCEMIEAGLPSGVTGINGKVSQNILDRYLLNPRISNELLSPWRHSLRELGHFIDPQDILYFVKNVRIFDEYNPQRLITTPVGVSRLLASDTHSRDVFFIAMCRCNGIPARIEEIEGKIQYYFSGRWRNVDFNVGKVVAPAPQGYLQLVYDDNSVIKDPKFETHFTIAKIDDGKINTLNFRTKEGIEGSMSYKNTFTEPVQLDCGYYLLTTGTRMASGRVLSRLSFFNIEKDRTTVEQLVLPKDESDRQVIGSLNVESPVIVAPTFDKSTLIGCTGRGFYVCAFVRNNHEPSNHIINDFLAASWDKPVVFLYESQEELKKFNPSLFPAIGDNITFAVDSGKLLDQICNNLELKNVEMPIVILADSFGRICYISQGYTINLASRLM